MKPILAVIVGYVVWTLVWLGGNAGLRAFGVTPADPTSRLESASALLALLVLSMVASAVSGYVASRVSPSRAAHYTCAALLLATGAAVQWGARSLFPPWYHAVFLLALVPIYLLGARRSR